MTIDFLHLYTRCPHCTTMFRVAVTEIDTSDGWVKCGRCHKVFDCNANEIDPSAFIKNDDSAEQPEQDALDETLSDTSTEDQNEDKVVPQIPLFSEAEGKQKDLIEAQNPVSTNNDKHSDSKPAARVPDSQRPASELHTQTQSSPKSSVERRPVENKLDKKQQDQASKLQIQPRKARRVHPASPPPAPSLNQSGSSNYQNKPKPVKVRGPGLSKIIIAKAQGWKRAKGRSNILNSFTSLILVLALFVMLLWQVAVVNYSKLTNYGFLSAPLAGICSVINCNTVLPEKSSVFEILHANLRRHNSIPNVLSISAKLINFSSSDEILPTVRLDLTDEENRVVASRLVDLADNPQYVDPTISELAPGQDVKILFNINVPSMSAYGFELNLIEPQ